jgi:hypothetical protein
MQVEVPVCSIRQEHIVKGKCLNPKKVGKGEAENPYLE